MKQANKDDLAQHVRDTMLAAASIPTSIFDVQVKRLHEYKRQLLNALHIVALWTAARRDPSARRSHRAPFLFGAQGGAGLPHGEAHHPAHQRRSPTWSTATPSTTGLQVVFLPNYRVSLAERIIPAADLSEQISTAGKEASGTGNMKFALNGALTIGTLDGANIEIREAVGAENFFLFGLTADEVVGDASAAATARARSTSATRSCRRSLDLIALRLLLPRGPRPVPARSWTRCSTRTAYLVLADFAAYARAQRERGARPTSDPEAVDAQGASSTSRGWAASPPTAPSASTRSDIWGISSVPVTL